MGATKFEQKFEMFGSLEDLEKNHRDLAEKLNVLNHEDAGFGQDVKAMLIALADDLAGAVSDLALSIDERYRTRKRDATQKS